MTFASVEDGKVVGAEGGEDVLQARYDCEDWGDIVALVLEVSSGCTDCG